MIHVATTPEELLGYFAGHVGADPANGVPAEPGSPGHSEPWEPWSEPVMVIPGFSPGGDPWLYMACVCGWWLGFGPQLGPSYITKVRDSHAETCEKARVTAGPGRWEALKDYLRQQIDQDSAVRRDFLAAGDMATAAPHGGLVSANRSTLSKMRELEG